MKLVCRRKQEELASFPFEFGLFGIKQNKIMQESIKIQCTEDDTS